MPQRSTPVDCLRLHFAQTRWDGPIRCKRRASGERSRIQLPRHRYRPRYQIRTLFRSNLTLVNNEIMKCQRFRVISANGGTFDT